MKKILFICHGNICRSPMAQMMFENKIKELGLKDIIVDSMAVSYEEEGNSIYPNAKDTLENHGIAILPHKARRFESSDYNCFDYILCMDSSNLTRLNKIHSDTENKYHLLLEYTGKKEEVSDPWYTRDFEKCYFDIERGINSFLKVILNA